MSPQNVARSCSTLIRKAATSLRFKGWFFAKFTDYVFGHGAMAIAIQGNMTLKVPVQNGCMQASPHQLIT